ncbi:formylglycine-generating enzyme family protein [bacterium]|nr:formylglycine-generating enzyme family protein [bacterium]
MIMRIVRLFVVVALLGALLAGCDGGCSCKQEAEVPPPEPELEVVPEPSGELEVIRPDTADVLAEEPPPPPPKPKVEPEPAPEPVAEVMPAPEEKPVRERTPMKELRKEPIDTPPPPLPDPVIEPEPEPEPPQEPEIRVLEGPYGMTFARIPEGTYTIGSAPGEPGRDIDEGPEKEVSISEFWLAQSEVTLRQWKAVMGELPFRWQSGSAPPDWTLDEPVHYVNWHEAHEFLAVLSEKTGHAYRLPTEAEWEYACRGWQESRFWCGDNEDALRVTDHVGPYGVMHEVTETGIANPFGLYDMHGNVSEWVEDDYIDNYRDLSEDGRPQEKYPRLPMKIARGGSFLSSPDSSRSAAREPLEATTRFSTIGFRVATDRMTDMALRR